MAHAVSIAKLTNPARVDWALGHAAVHQRFGEGDLASILAANLDPATPAALRGPGRTSPSPRAPPGGPPSAPPRPPPATAPVEPQRPQRLSTRGGQPMTTTTATTRTGPPPAGVPTAPPLPEDVHALLRRLRMPHTRAAAPEVLATARAQRWEPVEVLRALFTAEVAGRDRSSLATRRAGRRSRPGKRSTPGNPKHRRSRRRRSRRCGPWNGCTARRTSSSAGRPGPGKRSCSKPSGSSPSNKACTSPGSPWKTSAG